jgi:hypothetical protein
MRSTQTYFTSVPRPLKDRRNVNIMRYTVNLLICFVAVNATTIYNPFEVKRACVNFFV